MNNNVKQYFHTMPKHVAIIGAFLAGIIVAGVIFWVSKSGSKADNLMPRAARIERVEGSVGLSHAQAPTQKDVAEPEWEEATRNAPLVTGDRVYAREGSRATVAFTGRNHARLDSGSALDVLSLADHRTQLALRNGSATFDIGELEDGELFEVGTPYGAIDFQEPGLYQMGIGDDNNVWISVLSGLAQAIGSGGTQEIGQGEILTLAGQAATQLVLSKIAPEYAGGIVNDYYDDRYPDTYDGRYRDYNTYLEDPDYYDEYSRSASYRYVPDDIPGVYDLDDYGDWSEVEGYGHCWAPRVDNDWVPYRNGNWDVGSAYGPTWVSQEPWGWAPYHYGRWAYVNNRQWIWVPDSVHSQPVYAPALVAFVPITRSQQIGWVPLAPGEQYVPRYYDADFQTRYFASPEVVAEVVNVQQTYVNYNYPQAITVVPVQDFTRVVESRRMATVNPQFMALAQPMLDPYAIDSVRNVAIANDSDRPKFKMDRAFRNQVLNTPVVTSVEPVALPGRENMIGDYQVATGSEKQRKNKMKAQEGGQVSTANAPNSRSGDSIPPMQSSVATQARDQQVAELAARSAQGDRTARRELKKLARQQDSGQPGEQNSSVGQAQVQSREFKQMNNQPGVEVGQNPRKAQRQLDRQQMNTVEQQRTQVIQQAQEETRAQRKAQKRAENVTGQQQQMQPAQQESQKQQMRAAQQAEQNAQIEQRRAQKQAARGQQMNPQQQVQEQVNQQRQMKQQMKQQRQLQEQQMQQQHAAQEQVNQQRQMKQQRKQEQQRQIQEQQINQQQQMKQQRRQEQVNQQQMQQQVNSQRQMKQQMKQQRQVQEQQIQQRQVQEQQVQQQRQQRQMQKQQMRQQQQMQQQSPQGNPSVAVPQADKQQRKAERRAMQEQARPQVSQPQQQQQPPKAVEYKGPPVSNDAGNQSQRRAEKAQRKAGKGNQ